MNHANQQFVGVTTSLVDFQTGVTATQSFQREFASHQSGIGSLFLIFHRGRNINATGTTDIKFTFRFRIKIQKNLALQRTGLQAESAIHTGFFVFGNQSFQRTMLQVLGLKHSHDGSHSQPVVGSERCSIGLYPVAVHVCLNGVLGKVVHLIVVLLRNHVHVCLQDNPLTVLHARRGRFADNDIASLIHKRFQT